METSELTLLDLQNFFEKLKEHVRSEVEKYVDEKVKEIKDKDKAATCVMNKVLNNMVDNKSKAEPKIDKLKEIIEIDDGLTQNEEVIKALFIGRTLVGKYKKKTYEVTVGNEGKFICNGEEYNAPSTVGTRITGKSCNGWDFFKVCLDPEEGLRTLGYHRARFLSAQNRS